MSGRVLIVDSIATNRILLRTKLAAAHYTVLPRATPVGAQEVLAAGQCDLVIIAFDQPGAHRFCAGLRADPATAMLPVIATGAFLDEASRIAALRSGVDDIITRPMNDAVFLARIRSLLRNGDTVSELQLRPDTQHALGFAEERAGYIPAAGAAQGRVAVVAAGGGTLSPAIAAMMAGLPAAARQVDPGAVLGDAGFMPVPDLVVIDGGAGSWANGASARDVFRLVADLHSRSATRHAAQLVILPEGASDMAAMALDLGANDLASDRAGPEELHLRASGLLRRKFQADRMRDTLVSGLEASVIDPLTGLYNRRYALPHLARVAEEAQRTGKDFALMMLDIDHFKAINDAHGHAMGDRVLAEVAARLRDGLREIDLIARIGGEEFLIVMPATEEDQARAMAERLRCRIEGAGFDLSSGHAGFSPTGVATVEAPAHVTLSIGVAMGGAGEGSVLDVARLFESADSALYAAKTAGRNKVTICHSAA